MHDSLAKNWLLIFGGGGGEEKKVLHYGRSGNGERKVVSPILGISILPLDGNLNLRNINCQDILPSSLYVLSMSTLANG